MHPAPLRRALDEESARINHTARSTTAQIIAENTGNYTDLTDIRGIHAVGTEMRQYERIRAE